MVPPDPIPNSEVKRRCADGSVGLPHVRVGHRQVLNVYPELKSLGFLLVGKQLVDAGLFSSYCDEEVFQIIEDRAKRYLQAIR